MCSSSLVANDTETAHLNNQPRRKGLRARQWQPQQEDLQQRGGCVGCSCRRKVSIGHQLATTDGWYWEYAPPNCCLHRPEIVAAPGYIVSEADALSPSPFVWKPPLPSHPGVGGNRDCLGSGPVS